MNFYKLTALLASIFSVIFSLSIIKELFNSVPLVVLILMSVFLVLFVIYNEVSKVRELQKYYKKRKHNVLAIAVTFIISLFLSGVGIYFYSNNSLDTEIALNNDLKEQKLSIERKYQFQLDSLNNVPISSPEYIKLVDDIDFWRNRKSDSKEQRQEILSNIKELELKRENLYNTIKKDRSLIYERILTLKSNELDLLLTQNTGKEKKQDRSNFISWVFVLMVIVTEFIILNVQRQIANFYTPEQVMLLNIVKNCEYRNLKGIDINEFKFSTFNKNKQKFLDQTHTDADWKETKKAYNLLKELNIIKGLDGDFVTQKSSQFLTSYFNKINKL